MINMAFERILEEGHRSQEAARTKGKGIDKGS
jgi:hypothetical protein